VPNTTTKPICPNCGYDLAGLIEPETTATCPECSTDSTYQAATEAQSRWNVLMWDLILFLVIPMAINLIAYLIVQVAPRELFEVLYILILPYLLLPLVLLVAIPTALVVEGTKRMHLGKAQRKPAGWIFVICIVIPGTFSLLLSLAISLIWLVSMSGA
tara:strand:+ start:569 stop:1042 length:474 start_codon:yes stop_codon:yes gene_type:complete